MHVIVADDDEASRYLLVSMLSAAGHQVVGAEDGRAALEAARQSPPDLIISDILMPGMDGYQLCREWRADERLAKIPFIFYSANYTEPDDERFAVSLGADRFFVKPMDPAVLMREINAVMHQSEAGELPTMIPEADESALLKEYNARLVNKLERQLAEVETANRQLRETADALRQTEQALRGLISAAPAAIITLDTDQNVSMWNPAAESIFGWTQDEVIGRPCPLARQADGVDCTGLLREANSEISGYEAQIRAKSGRQVDVSISAAYLGDNTADGILALFTDITDQKETKTNLATTVNRLSGMMDGTVSAIAKIVEARDPYTSGHQERVAQLSSAIAEAMGFDDDLVSGIRIAGLIHDIGKVYVPAEILTKPRQLTDVEFNIVKLHPQVAYEVLSSIDFPWPIATYVVQHHERLDGTGYPDHLKGDDILLGSRILAVADVVEAMSSHRPYKAAPGLEAALEEIETNANRLYDAQVVESCIRVFREQDFKFVASETGSGIL